MVQDSQGNTASGMGTGFAIGNPGEPVEYIVTNGHVVQMAYEYPRIDPSISGKVQVYYSAAENDYVQAQVVYYSSPSEKDIAILKLPSPTDKRESLSNCGSLIRSARARRHMPWVIPADGCLPPELYYLRRWMT